MYRLNRIAHDFSAEIYLDKIEQFFDLADRGAFVQLGEVVAVLVLEVQQ